MFRVLDGEDIGMMLTDSYAMYPASSVSGFTSATRNRSTSTSA